MQRSEIVANLAAPWHGPDDGGAIRAPATLLVPGTHCGSGGCIDYSAELLRRTASRWNGTPVVINHPMDVEGLPISVQHAPEQVIGRLRNARFEDGKLRADIEVTSGDPNTRALVQQIRELSTGLYNFAEAGEATDVVPDHLALLPDVPGACSWEDGCGVRTHSNPQVREAALQVLAERFHEVSIGLNTLGGNDAMKTSVSIHRSKLVEPGDLAAHGGQPEPLYPTDVDPAAAGDEGPLLPTGVVQHQREEQHRQEREARERKNAGEPEPNGQADEDDAPASAALMPTGLNPQA